MHRHKNILPSRVSFASIARICYSYYSGRVPTKKRKVDLISDAFHLRYYLHFQPILFFNSKKIYYYKHTNKVLDSEEINHLKVSRYFIKERLKILISKFFEILLYTIKRVISIYNINYLRK